MFRILLEEDLAFGDITSELVVPGDVTAEARIIAREKCVLAGTGYLRENLGAMGLEVKTLPDSSEVNAGEVVMSIRGNARKILATERTVLNILGRMSGIATETRKVVEKVRHINPRVKVAATRKTLWGKLDKMAVVIGGGDPHRWNLGDMVMIKDNHIALVGFEEALRRARRASFTKKIEVEVEDEEHALLAAELGADIIMLDNMPPDRVCAIARKLKELGVTVEVSGGINFENIAEYANCDVDVISLGYLTHSVRSINFSMEIQKVSQ